MLIKIVQWGTISCYDMVSPLNMRILIIYRWNQKDHKTAIPTFHLTFWQVKLNGAIKFNISHSSLSKCQPTIKNTRNG